MFADFVKKLVCKNYWNLHIFNFLKAKKGIENMKANSNYVKTFPEFHTQEKKNKTYY